MSDTALDEIAQQSCLEPIAEPLSAAVRGMQRMTEHVPWAAFLSRRPVSLRSRGK